MPLELTITKEEKIPITIAPKTVSGNPAVVDGPAKIELMAGGGTFVVGEDGLSAYLISGDNIEDVVYKVSVDADRGEGVRTIEDLITVHVVDAEAAALGITAGAAEPK